MRSVVILFGVCMCVCMRCAITQMKVAIIKFDWAGSGDEMLTQFSALKPISMYPCGRQFIHKKNIYFIGFVFPFHFRLFNATILCFIAFTLSFLSCWFYFRSFSFYVLFSPTVSLSDSFINCPSRLLQASRSKQSTLWQCKWFGMKSFKMLSLSNFLSFYPHLVFFGWFVLFLAFDLMRESREILPRYHRAQRLDQLTLCIICVYRTVWRNAYGCFCCVFSHPFPKTPSLFMKFQLDQNCTYFSFCYLNDVTRYLHGSK